MKKIKKSDKTNQERILQIYSLAESHFGEVRFVGIKYENKIGWIAKIQFDSYESLIADSDNPTDALRKLRNRIKKIILIYNTV